MNLFIQTSVFYPCKEYYFAIKKWNTDTCYNLGDTCKQYAKSQWNTPVTRDQILFDSILT